MRTKASSFADLADVRAFKKWKRIYLDQGYSDARAEKLAFAKGDNGIGCWGTVTAQEETPMCALPPDDMIEKWGTVAAAKHKKVQVTANGETVICVLADRMPWKKNIKNGAGIDLNPAAAKHLSLKPPFMVPAEWSWA